MKSKVSIPYRHSKNLNDWIKIDKRMWFQFLIGTLKTRWYCYINRNSSMFQFLIGTLKTWNVWIPVIFPIYMFQFLIGTLKTLFCYKCISNKFKVSIPYRHSKNNIFNSKIRFKHLVSIPYRHSKNMLQVGDHHH